MGFTFASRTRGRGRGFSGSSWTVNVATWGWVLSPISHSRTRENGAAEQRRLHHAGVDPLDAKAAQRLAALKGKKFRECALDFIERNRAGWRNAKHRQQWQNTLETYAYPILGELPVSEIDTGLVVQVLDPIWTEKPETASRVRGRIEAVLDAATVRVLRQGPNPA